MKKVLGVHRQSSRHWVGDGFPVKTLFFYGEQGEQISPFLLLDLAGPHEFSPTTKARGVGQHPHRGFETVTIVYEGEVAHKDSTGRGGTIGPGDVQWMTAAKGIIHEEFHSPAFARSGGPFRMVQLWVNLPAADKLRPPSYQAIAAADIPVIELDDDAGRVRVIAGDFKGRQGAAATFSPVNVWDMRLTAGVESAFDLPEGHTAMLVVLSGRIKVNGVVDAREAEMVLLDRAGTGAVVNVTEDAEVLVLTGEPIAEPIVGHGPFVMNTENEILEAFEDFRTGRFGAIA